MLSVAQRRCRQSGRYAAQFRLTEKTDPKLANMASFMKFLHRNLIVHPSRTWQVDECLIDYNLTRLHETTAHVLQRWVHATVEQYRTAYFMHEWTMALEIFMQIDGEWTMSHPLSLSPSNLSLQWTHSSWKPVRIVIVIVAVYRRTKANQHSPRVSSVWNHPMSITWCYHVPIRVVPAAINCWIWPIVLDLPYALLWSSPIVWWMATKFISMHQR